MRPLVYLLALLLTLPACAQRGLTKQPPRHLKNRPVTVPTKPEPVIVFQRTPCNGTCPVYTATIFADGRVEYDGQRFVKFLGAHTLSLPVATINDILAEAKRINFTQFKERYSGNTTDLPAAIITVHPVGQPAHAVYAEEDFPASLKAYIAYVGARLDPLTQQGLEK